MPRAAATTKKPAPETTEPPEAEQRPVSTPEPEPQVAQPVWATRDSLGGAEPWRDIVLPGLGLQVRVRRLDTTEVARLQFLPDLLNFQNLVMKLQIAQEAAKLNRKARRELKVSEIDDEALLIENYRYQAHLAHLAVIDHDAEYERQFCDYCGFEHYPSLWQPDECKRLLPPDLTAIGAVALGTREVEAIGPLSADETD
jgi:hypothetical protein